MAFFASQTGKESTDLFTVTGPLQTPGKMMSIAALMTNSPSWKRQAVMQILLFQYQMKLSQKWPIQFFMARAALPAQRGIINTIQLPK